MIIIMWQIAKAGSLRIVFTELLLSPQTIDEMQAKHIYPNRKLFLALLDVLSKHGHTSLIVEVHAFVPCMNDKAVFN